MLRLADPATQRQDGRLAYDADVRLRDVVLRASKAIDGKFADHRPWSKSSCGWTLGNTLLGMGRGPTWRSPTTSGCWRSSGSTAAPTTPARSRSMNGLANGYNALGRHAEAAKLHGEAAGSGRPSSAPTIPRRS
ncbi:MAG: hypothetical protein U0797_04655 [Gemmataceae bacterium]